MRVELVCNDDSGGGTDRTAVAAALSRHGATLVEAGPERVVVAGGDGTVGEGAAHAAALDLPLAVIPTGTANDFARAHGLPTALDDAARLAATGTETAEVELGRAGGRPFLNTAAAGLATDAGRRAVPLKRVLGPLAYPVGAALAAARDRPVPATVTAGGRELFRGRAWQVMVACTGAFGGGAEVGGTDPHDGLLDVVVIPAGPRAALLRYGAALRRGRIAVLPATHDERVEEVVVTGVARWNVDGELVDLGDEVVFTTDRRPVRLVTGPQ